MVDGAEGEDEKSSPLLQNERPLQPEGDSPRALPAQASPGLTPRSLSSFSYRMPTFPRNVSVCQLAGGASEEESKQHKRIQRKLIAALILAFIFMLVEVVGGVMAHSLAIITDAAHLLSDVSGFAVAVLAAFWAKRKSQEHFSYGYHRVEVLGALASVMTVWLVTGILLFEAVQRIITPEPVDGKLMFIIAVIGVGVNILMMAVLGHNHGGQPCSHSHGHSHDHSHSHAPGHGCGGHSHAHGKSCSKRQLAPALEVAAEMSRSNSRAGGCCNGHGHGHTHAHKCSEDADLEAGHAGHAHAHSPHGSERIKSRHHNHHHCSSEEHGHTHVHDHSGDGCADHHHHCSSDEEEAELLASGRAPILAGGPRSHEANGQEPGPSQGHAHSHDHGKPHGGGSDHSQANLNMRGAIIHVIGDFVQSIGVAIAGALIWWHQDDPRWYIADPICTFLFAILVLWTTRAILRDISDVLMERVPRGFCIKTLHDDLSRVPGVESVADLHVWSLTPGIPLLCAHVGVADGADPTDVLHALTAHCRSLGIEHSTIQLMSCGAACDAC